MRELDETDLEILRLLLADARRPYSDIADAVGLSAPAVSDRIARLRETGVIRRFTLDVDRSQLRDGIPVLVDVGLVADYDAASARATLLDAGGVEHVFTTATGDFVVSARVPNGDVDGWLTGLLGDGAVDTCSVTLLSSVEWAPDLGGAEFALSCALCGNTVDAEGTSTRIDGTLYQFCCSSCEARFEEKYESLREGTD